MARAGIARLTRGVGSRWFNGRADRGQYRHHASDALQLENKYIDIFDALKKGKEVADYEVENAMHKSAIGYFVEETKTYINEVEGVKTRRIEKTKNGSRLIPRRKYSGSKTVGRTNGETSRRKIKDTAAVW